jgi:hypothetical protein
MFGYTAHRFLKSCQSQGWVWIKTGPLPSLTLDACATQNGPHALCDTLVDALGLGHALKLSGEFFTRTRTRGMRL